jgi:RNA polymerase sigma-70 factor (ECF subfamily)
VEAFEALRRPLFGIAYRMLGSVMEAEDVVQDAYLRFREVNPLLVRSPEAFLRTTVMHLSLDHLKSAQVQRESYIGNWLPEPLLTTESESSFADPADEAAIHESISMAFMLLLESLSPDERAVFLLHEVFDYDHNEIASMLNKSVEACRQLLSRARKHVMEHRPRFESSPEIHRKFVTQFMQAAQAGELAGLSALLTEDVTQFADGGGRVSAAPHPVRGREMVARLILGMMRGMRLLKPKDTWEVTQINGYDGFCLRDERGYVEGVLCFEIIPEGIRSLYFIANPEKLRHLQHK